MDRKKVLFVADFSITKEAVLENISCFEKYHAEVSVIEVAMGDSKEERAAYILKTEQEGPEWAEPPQELLEMAREAEIIITDFVAIGKKVIDAARNLKLIGVLRSGVENVNVAYATEKNIQVISSPGRVAAPVADYTVGMILAESRNIVRSNLVSSQGEWTVRFRNFPYSHNLDNKTVGIIGFGAIGQMVAKRLQPFGVKLLAYEPFLPGEKVEEAGAAPVSLEQLLRESDFVTIHARLAEETRGMMGLEQFRMMKPTAFFINTARAGLVDEEALIQVLQNHEIGGAALDVFAQEPIARDNPLLALDNVTLTPHLAGTTSNVGSNSIAVIMGDLERYFTGSPLMHIMN